MISLVAVGFLSIIGAGSFWAWFTGLVTFILVMVMACAPPKSNMVVAIVAAVFSLITFVIALTVAALFLDGGYHIYCPRSTVRRFNRYDDYYNDNYWRDDDTACQTALGAIGIISSLFFLAVGVLAVILSVRYCRNSFGGAAASAGTEIPDVEATVLPEEQAASKTVKIVEKVNADGSKTVTRTEIDPETGVKTVTESVITPVEEDKV